MRIMEMAVLQRRFQDAVRALMANAGMNQRKLAAAMGVSEMYVSKYLNGLHSPGLDVIEKFAKPFEVDPHELLEPAGEKIAG
jgi:transcriptional regulator with XRE-family HTH domain